MSNRRKALEASRSKTPAAQKQLAGQQANTSLSQVSTKDLEAIVFGLQEGEEESNVDTGQPDNENKEALPSAAWSDPDDAVLQVPLVGDRHKKRLRQDDSQVTGQEYERLLRKRFLKLNGSAHWAALDPSEAQPSDSEEDVGEVASTRNPVVASTGLQARTLDIKRLRELPLLAAGQKKAPSAVEALQFHPTSELLLTAGRDKTLRLFAVDGEENPKVASYYFKNYPILDAKFTPAGDQVLMTSSSSQIWGLDVSSGEPFEMRSPHRSAPRCLAMGPGSTNERSSHMYGFLGDAGAMSLCDIKTKHTIRTFRMSSSGIALVFAPHQACLYSADEECNIYEWDITSGRCRQKVKEQWTVRIQHLAVSAADKPKLAVGSATGNIDFFELGASLSREPDHSIGNLTTRIDALRFNADGQILAAASRLKPGALKLVHTGTMSVFQNWPTQRTPLHRVSALDFSSDGGMLAVGNEAGRANPARCIGAACCAGCRRVAYILT